MASAQSKGISMDVSKAEATTLCNALEMMIASVKRAMVKETNNEVLKLREAQVNDLRALSNKIQYGSKELV